MAYPVEASDVAFSGRLSRVRVDRVRFPDGHVAEREVVEHPSAVGVVALDANDRIVLLRQYRHPVGDRLLEIPAGKLDVDGEAVEDAIRRELLEEARVVAGEFAHLVTFWNSAGWADERTTVYLAADAVPAQAPEAFVAEAEEAHMEVVWLPFADALDMARTGEITDAKTLIGILLAATRR